MDVMFMGYGTTPFLGIGYGYEKQKFLKRKICDHCGKEGNAEIFMSYMYISVLFHPVLKWHKRYYLQMDCCGQHRQIDAKNRFKNLTDKEEEKCQ